MNGVRPPRCMRVRSPQVTNPPIAPSRPVTRSLFGETVIDEYGWLHDRTDPETIAHLKAENAHAETVLRRLEPLRPAMADEIVRRTQLSEISPPARRGEWWYASHTKEGHQYPSFVRMHRIPHAPERVILDANELAAGHDYLSIGVFEMSPDHRLVAYSVDIDGSEPFILRFHNLDSGEDLEDEIRATYYTGAWSAPTPSS